MTEFSNLGAHCAVCRQQDFLPFRCTDCARNFCSDHRTPADHKCPSLLAEAKRKIKKLKRLKTGSKARRCKHKACKKRSMVLEECRDCGMEFCATHRFTDDHRCRGKRRISCFGTSHGVFKSPDVETRKPACGPPFGVFESPDAEARKQPGLEKRAPLIYGAFYGTPCPPDTERCNQEAEAEDLELALRLQRSLYGCGEQVRKETDTNDYILNYAY